MSQVVGSSHAKNYDTSGIGTSGTGPESWPGENLRLTSLQSDQSTQNSQLRAASYQQGLPSVPPLAADLLSLEQITLGVSVSPDVEIRNGDVEGFDALDSAGIEWLVLLYRDPLPDRSLDNTTPPRTLSMERKDVSADGRTVESLVRHFDIVSTLSDKERELTSANLGRAADLLRVPETFEQGLCALDDLCGRGELISSAFRPSSKAFEAPLPGTPGFNLKDFEIRLKVWLHEQGVHYETWGREEAKDIEDLAKELSEGEGTLSVEDGDVYLENKVVLLWLESPDGKQRLFEDYQEFSDGRVRRRRNLGALPAEKAVLVRENKVENRSPIELFAMEGEHPVQAVRRLLAEELGITRLIEIERGDVSVRLEPSQCYPGIWKRNTYIVHRARIDERDYRPSYEEVGPKRTTKFIWKPIPATQQVETSSRINLTVEVGAPAEADAISANS